MTDAVLQVSLVLDSADWVGSSLQCDDSRGWIDCSVLDSADCLEFLDNSWSTSVCNYAINKKETMYNYM